MFFSGADFNNPIRGEDIPRDSPSGDRDGVRGAGAMCWIDKCGGVLERRIGPARLDKPGIVIVVYKVCTGRQLQNQHRRQNQPN